MRRVGGWPLDICYVHKPASSGCMEMEVNTVPIHTATASRQSKLESDVYCWAKSVVVVETKRRNAMSSSVSVAVLCGVDVPFESFEDKCTISFDLTLLLCFEIVAVRVLCLPRRLVSSGPASCVSRL